MNKKKMLPLAILAGVVVVLAVVLALLSLLNSEDEDSGIPLFSVTSDSVTLLSYQDGSSDVALTKAEDGSWTLDSDTLLPIDTDSVNEVLDGLTGMTALRALNEGDVDADTAGLDSPTMQFQFTADGTEHTLVIGTENSMAAAYYAQLDGSSLYTISTSNFVGLCKTPRQLYKAQEITDIESSDVATLTLENGSETLTFNRDSDGNWTLADDPDYDLDQDTVSKMSNTICSLTSEWSITAPGEDSQYGLDTPNATVTLTATDGRSVRCVFGKTDVDGDDDVVYLRSSGDESVVYEVDSNHLNAFAYTKDTLKAATPETAEAAEG